MIYEIVAEGELLEICDPDFPIRYTFLDIPVKFKSSFSENGFTQWNRTLRITARRKNDTSTILVVNIFLNEHVGGIDARKQKALDDGKEYIKKYFPEARVGEYRFNLGGEV